MFTNTLLLNYVTYIEQLSTYWWCKNILYQ